MIFQNILLSIIGLVFFYINYKIVQSDIQYKKIPNEYLGYLILLIPFWWIILFAGIGPNYLPGLSEINPLLFSTQIIITFLVSFILYYFGIWAAGDAKYLLVLSLFIPYIGVIPFLGNIALITIAYLVGYFIYFYLGKVLFNRNYRKNLFLNIKQDLSETWEIHKSNKGGNAYKIITKFLLVFFIIFVSIRLSRIYLFNSFIENGNRMNLISEIIQKYDIYIVFLGIGLFIGGLYFFRLFLSKVKAFISQRLQLNIEIISNVFILVLSVILLSFISYELINNYTEISILLFRVFTLYLALYISIKVLIYSYKITFGIGELSYKDFKDLKEGDIVDKKYLIEMFSDKITLEYLYRKNYKLKGKYKKRFLYGNQPANYYTDLQTPLGIIDVQKIKSLLNARTKIFTYCKRENYTPPQIKVLHAFSFGPYLFGAFIVTLIFKNSIITFCVKGISNVVIML